MTIHFRDALIDDGSTAAVAADGALVLTAKMRHVILLNSTTGAKSVSVPAVPDGCTCSIILKQRSGGSYTIAATNISTAGTVTLDAAGEGVRLVRAAGVWHVFELLGGATHA